MTIKIGSDNCLFLGKSVYQNWYIAKKKKDFLDSRGPPFLMLYSEKVI